LGLAGPARRVAGDVPRGPRARRRRQLTFRIRSARRKNAPKGGVARGKGYQVTDHGKTLTFDRSVTGDQHDVRRVKAFSSGALFHLVRWLQIHKPTAVVTHIDTDGTIHYRKE
jgi:hypothetical protein